MVRDGIRKSWEAVENTVWENPSRWSGEHDRAGQHNNARGLSCTENCILAQEDIFWHEKMIAGTKIAALDHNHNVNREQVQTTIIQATIIFFAISINLIYSII